MKESFELVRGCSSARVLEIVSGVKDLPIIGETRRAIFKCVMMNDPKVHDLSDIVLVCVFGETAEKMVQKYQDGDIISLSYNGLVSHLTNEDENK